MSEAETRLARLQQIASVMADIALAPVAAASAEVRRIEDQIAEIADHRAKLTASAGDPSIAGTMLAQAERLRQRQAVAMTELAAAHVHLDAMRRAAAKAVGRNRALEGLSNKHAAAARLEEKRRLLR